MKKRWFKVQPIMFFVFVGFAIWMYLFILSPMLYHALAEDQNMVNLGLVGQWNDYGVFYGVKVWENEEVRQEGKIWVSYACCATSKGLVIFDINRRSVASFIPLGECYDLEIDGPDSEEAFYVYIAGGKSGLYIFNINNPKKPYYVAQCVTPGLAQSVAMAGDYVYMAEEQGGLRIIDISNKNAPQIVGSCNTPGYAKGVTIEGDYAYIADGQCGLQIIDISNKRGPKIIDNCYTSDVVLNVVIVDDYAYITDGDNGLQIIDISNKNEVGIVGSCDTHGHAEGLDIRGAYAYITNSIADNGHGFQVIDISNKSEPKIVGSCDTPGSAKDVTIGGDNAYVADGSGGLQIIDISSKSGPKIVGNCDIPGSAKDVTIEGNYAYIAVSGHGLQVIDINSKSEPKIVGSCDTPGYAHSLAIAGEYAYVADGSRGLQIIDISNKNAPQIIGNCDTPDHATDVAIVDDYAYITDWENGLFIIDISSKNGPMLIGSIDTPGYAGGVVIEGDYSYVADGAGGLLVIDINNKNIPKIVGSFNTPDFAAGVALEGNYAYIADSGQGLHIIDISNKNAPVLVGSCDILDHASDVAIEGDYAYVADQRSGLQIIDITNKSEPKIVGSRDTSGFTRGVVIENEYAYIADDQSGLQIIDISNKNGPKIIESLNTFDFAARVTIEGNYAYVVDQNKGLNIIDISNKNGLMPLGICDTPGGALDMAVAGNYAYVADGHRGLQVIDINNKCMPKIVGICDTPGNAADVAVAGNYAYVAVMLKGLQIIDISNKSRPQIVGGIDISGNAQSVVVAGNYAYVVDEFSLQIIDISNKSEPIFVGKCYTTNSIEPSITIANNYAYIVNGDIFQIFGGGLYIIDISNKSGPMLIESCDTPGSAEGVAIAGNYAYVADGKTGLQIIDITNKSEPTIIGSYDTPGDAKEVIIGGEYDAKEVIIGGEYVYVANGKNGLLKLKIDIGPSSKGNLVLVAGGGANPENTLWPATQAQANHVFNTFINNCYEVYDIWYQNPVSFQDIDYDGIINQLVVDDSTPTKGEFLDTIINWAMETPNTGPLYIYLIGHGAEDRFQIMPNEVITAKEIKDSLDKFQNGYTDDNGVYHPGTNRQMVVIIESAASGTFIDDLRGDNITVITSTDNGPSYVKPDFFDANTPYSAPAPPGQEALAYLSFTSAFVNALDPYLNPNTSAGPEAVISNLKESFNSAVNILQEWALQGLPFADQAPQMVLPAAELTSLSFSADGQNPLEGLFIDQNMPYHLTLIGKDTLGNFNPFSSPILFFSVDPNIIDPSDITTYIDAQGVPWYRIIPKKNGNITLVGLCGPGNPNIFLTARLNIEVYIDDPGYTAGKTKRAIIIAGYKGSGDYLWQSTNTIANHAYRTLRAMGYGKREIDYYNPFLLQDLDGEGEYDEIAGYPHLHILNPDLPDSALGKIKQTGASDLVLFLVDHGSKDETGGSFCLNPTEALTSAQLMDWITEIKGQVDDTIIFVYDACYSGSFLSEIEQRASSDTELAEKLITITSTDPNQQAYYLNRGMVSFSYPFFDEWFLTHSLMAAFDYAKQFFPREGQTPLSSDPNRIILRDQEKIYYVDESRPVIFDPNVCRSQGMLAVSAQVYSLTGISQVWAMVESGQKAQATSSGKAITRAPQLSLALVSDPNYPYGGRYTLITQDPCPTESLYNLTLYARDKSQRAKVASHKISIAGTSEQKTMALILASDPNLFSQDEGNRLSAQINRAEAILKSKGLGDDDIKKITSLDDFTVPSLSEGQTLFIYLIGLVEVKENGPYFYLKADESIHPLGFESKLPGADQRVFILMDTPYATTFLSNLDWQGKENWAGLASTDQGHLFFPIGQEAEDLFPCFSNFFFSAVLSGASVAQGYRLANNAVSLTRQGPELFLSGQTPENYQTISSYLNYYLGTAAIPGEDYPLIFDCGAQIEDDHYILFLIAQPTVIIDNAWVVLTSPGAFYQESMIVDLVKDDLSILYQANIPSSLQYYQAYFMVEGRAGEHPDADSWTQWQEVSITGSNIGMGPDAFDPDDDPNSILFDPYHDIIVNALPARHTFYCEASQGCDDTDWVRFYALKNHIYEIYAQDLSEFGYFIQISLYDPNIRLCEDNGQYVAANNYLAFDCRQSGYYLLKARLASSYPPGGVEYILSVSDPLAGEYTSLLVQVEGFQAGCSPGVRGQMNGGYIYANNYCFYPDRYSYKFNGLGTGSV